MTRLAFCICATTLLFACAPGAPPARPGTNVRDVKPGDSISAAVAASRKGGTVVVHPGSYGHVTIHAQPRSRVVVKAVPAGSATLDGLEISDSQNLVVSGFNTTSETSVTDASHGITLDRISCSVAGATQLGDPNCFLIERGAHDVTLSRVRSRGGWDGVKVYSGGDDVSDWVHDVSVVRSDIAGAFEDNIHLDGVNGMLIAHNVIHDPSRNDLHNDGIQSQASNELKVVANRFFFDASGNVGTAIMLGALPAQFPNRHVTSTSVVNNIVTGWNGGHPLIVNGTERTRVVNNTFLNNGDDSIAAITVANQGASGQNPGLEIWNNILTGIWYDPGSQPAAFSAANLLTHPFKGMSGNRPIVANPKLQPRSYAPSKTSPARKHGLLRDGTPATDFHGRRRATPPGLGAVAPKPR